MRRTVIKPFLYTLLAGLVGGVSNSYTGWVWLTPVRAEDSTLQQAQDGEAHAMDEYYKAIKKEKNISPERRDELRKKIIEPAHAKTEELIEQRGERQLEEARA